MISMIKMRSIFGIRSNLEARRSTMKRRRAQFALRPMGEGLEGRELMASLGLDPTFGFGGISNTPNPANNATTYNYTSITEVALQSDGKTLGVGTRSVNLNVSPYTSTSNIVVTRANSDGSLDGSYGSGGVFVVPSLPFGGSTIELDPVASVLQSDGKLVILAHANGTPTGGLFSISDFAVVRLLPNGALDTSFGSGGYSDIDFGTSQTTSDQSDTPTSIAIGPNGQIVVAGYTFTTSSPSSQDFAVAELSGSGTLITSFGTGGKQIIAFNKGGDLADRANAVAVQSDGKVVLVGSADVGTVTINSTVYQNSDIAVARLTAQGILDTTFGTNGLATIAYDLGYDNKDTGNAVVLLPNQIVIGGSSDVSNSVGFGTVETATLTRLSTTAAISSKFSLNLVQQGASFSTEGNTLTPLADGSLLLGGNANSLNGNAYGEFFTNFFAGGGVNTAYGSAGTSILNGTSANGNVIVQPDGKLLFSTYGGIARTTAPAPAVVGDNAQLIFTSTSKNAKSNSIVVAFNTTLNASLAGNKSTYRVRIGKKGNRFAAIKNVSYNATTQSVTITLKQKYNRKTVLQVLIAPLGIAGSDSQFLNGGQNTTIPVVASM